MARFMPSGREPQSMQVAVLESPGRLTLTERSMPSPAADEVLVRIRAVGICGSDVH
jgi:L-iditol 2-dehydrogenase